MVRSGGAVDVFGRDGMSFCFAKEQPSLTSEEYSNGQFSTHYLPNQLPSASPETSTLLATPQPLPLPP